MTNSSISTIMGPSGPRGPQAPIGSTGPSGPSGPTGSTGATGEIGYALVGWTAGTINCKNRVLVNADGTTASIGPVSGNTAGSDGSVGTAKFYVQQLGGGAKIFKNSVGDTAFFRSFRTSPDITINETGNNIELNAPLGSGLLSQVVGKTGELLHYAGTTFIRGADDTFFAEGVSAEEGSLQAVIGDFKELIKRYDPVNNESITVDTTITNNHYVVGRTGFEITDAVANVHGFEPVTTDGVTFGETVNTTFIIKNGGLATNQNPFNEDKFLFSPAGPTFTRSGTDIVNCITFNNGDTWQCFIAGKDYDTTFDGTLRVGACCQGPDQCSDYVLSQNCSGTFFNRVSCNADPCDGTLGACCVNNSCFNYSLSKCDDIGGQFFSNLSCGEFTCPGPCDNLGCCCLGIEGQVTSTKPICDNLGGVFNADKSCEEFIADGENGCEELTRGACCLPDTSKLCNVLPIECVEAGGIHMGAGTVCDQVDCCAGRSIPLGACCCSNGECNDQIVESLCPSQCQWTENAACDVCGTVLNCNCTEEGGNQPAGFKKWALWIKDIFVSNLSENPDSPDVKLLGSGVAVADISGPFGCDRLSDGLHNTYYTNYANASHNPLTEAIPYARSLNVPGFANENDYYIPSLNEMAFIVLKNSIHFNILIGDTVNNSPYWTSTRSSDTEFFTINEAGSVLETQMSNIGEPNLGKRAVVVRREMLENGADESGLPAVGEENADGEKFVGVFAAGCSVILSNQNTGTFELPTYTCSDPLETGQCCTNNQCSIANEYDCILSTPPGVYSGDNPDASCDDNPCEPDDPTQVETLNCARAGVISYKATEFDCAFGISKQLYYYAGTVDINGVPNDLANYDKLNVTGKNDSTPDYDIRATAVDADTGILAQGYCLGHDKAMECGTDRNILAPTAIAAATLRAYCNQDWLYGENYSCGDSDVCGQAKSTFDTVIDDCLSPNSIALCGKAIQRDTINILNELENTTCSTTNWPSDVIWIDSNNCAPTDGVCNKAIRIWNGEQANWPQATTGRASVFTCEPCLNAFCAYTTSVGDNTVDCCKSGGEWSDTCADLYKSYLESVYYNECGNSDNLDNPFCGLDATNINWLTLSNSDIGEYDDQDRVVFSNNSRKCRDELDQLRSSNLSGPDCNVFNNPEFETLQYVDYSVKADYLTLMQPLSPLPGGLNFQFVPVICNQTNPCIAGQSDWPSEFSNPRYTSLLYGINDPANENQSLIGSATSNSNLGLCIGGSCVDSLPSRSGTPKARIEATINQTPADERINEQRGLLITNCQNRVFCRGNSCTECGGFEDLVEPFDQPLVSCWNCSTGQCLETTTCSEDSSLFPAESCDPSDNPCPFGQCCDADCTETRLADCGGVWSQTDTPCPNGNLTCDCGSDALGNCCTDSVHSYTCQSQCAGAWEEGPDEGPGSCIPTGCCYQVENVSGDPSTARAVTSQTTQLECGGGDVSTGVGGLIFISWTEGVDCSAVNPTGRFCNTNNETCTDNVLPADGTIIAGSGRISIENWTLDGSCIGENPCNFSTDLAPICCQGIPATDGTGAFSCFEDPNRVVCFPQFINVVGSSTTYAGVEDTTCDDFDCSTQSGWGHCCYKSSDTAEWQCAYPVGEYHCLNNLHSDETTNPSWTLDGSNCDTCGDPKDPTLVNCCYNVDQFGTKRCRVVEEGNCTASILSGCGVKDMFGTNTNVNGSASEGSEVCDECNGCDSPSLVNCCFNNGSDCIMVPEDQCNTSGILNCGQGAFDTPVISGDVTDPTAIGCQECEEGSCETNLYIEGTQILQCGSDICPFGEGNNYSNLGGGGNPIFNQLKVLRIRFEERVLLGPTEYVIELEFDNEFNATQFIANYDLKNVNDVNNDPLGDQYIRFTKSDTDIIAYIPNVIPTRQVNFVKFSSFSPTFNPPTPSKPVQEFVEDSSGGNINYSAKYRIRFP